MELLIENGADVSAKDDDGNSIFHIVVTQSNLGSICKLKKMCTNPIFKFDPK